MTLASVPAASVTGPAKVLSEGLSLDGAADVAPDAAPEVASVSLGFAACNVTMEPRGFEDTVGPASVLAFLRARISVSRLMEIKETRSGTPPPSIKLTVPDRKVG